MMIVVPITLLTLAIDIKLHRRTNYFNLALGTMETINQLTMKKKGAMVVHLEDEIKVIFVYLHDMCLTQIKS